MHEAVRLVEVHSVIEFPMYAHHFALRIRHSALRGPEESLSAID